MNKMLGRCYLPFCQEKDLQGFVSCFFVTKLVPFGVTLQGSFIQCIMHPPFSFICLATE